MTDDNCTRITEGGQPRHDAKVWRYDALGLRALATEGVSAAQLWAALDRITAPTLVIRAEQSPLVICDNCPHHNAEVRTWCADHDYFTLDGTDYPSHPAQEQAIARYLRWANRHASPKRHYAVNSKIRQPDYLPNVA